MTIRDKITPGPWRMRLNGIMTPRIQIIGYDSAVGEIWLQKGEEETQVSFNAKAISKIPEMLRIIEQCYKANNGTLTYAFMANIFQEAYYLWEELNKQQ